MIDDDYEDVYEHAPCGYLLMSPDGRIGRINRTFSAWTGFDQDALHGRPFRELLTIAGRIFYETHFAPLLRMQGRFDEVALDLVCADGGRLPVLVNALERRGAEGHAHSIRLSVFNATDRRRYERELLAARDAGRQANEALSRANAELDRANRELGALYEALPVGLFRTDRDGRILQANARFVRISGIRPPATGLEAIDAAQSDEMAKAWQRLLVDGQPLRQAYRIRDTDPARHVEVDAVALHDASGAILGSVGVVEDISDRLAAAERQRSQIRETALRELTAGLAHNLNNLMTVIVDLCDRATEELPAEHPLYATAADAAIASGRAVALVRTLMIYAGHGHLFSGRSEVDRVAAEVAGRCRSAWTRPGRLATALSAPGAEVGLSETLLREVLEGLLANARDACSDLAEIRLETSLETAEHGTAVVLVVEDKGRGMDDAMLARARDPFYTAGAGTGLGLSLADGAARLADGEMRVRSVLGAGTRVELRLPTVPISPSRRTPRS